MHANYDKLWKLMIDRKISRQELKRKTNLCANVFTHMYKEEDVSLASLRKICEALDCDISDIMSFRGNE